MSLIAGCHVKEEVMATLDMAIRLVSQATSQDSAKNYEEAARCYREAIVAFRQVAQKKAMSASLRSSILNKCGQYEERLKKLDRYLISQADLSKLFRDCVKFHEQQVSLLPQDDHDDDDDDDDHQIQLDKGTELIDKAKRQDAKGRYLEALKSYEQGVERLLHVAQFSCIRNSKQAEVINAKCLLIHERIEAIHKHLETNSSLESISRHDGFSSCSPEPLCLSEETSEEDRALLMEEIRSNLSLSSSICGSRHSLYPTCEIRSSNRSSQHFQAIPLADLHRELQLSSSSLQSLRSSVVDVGTSLDESDDCIQIHADSDSGIFDRSKGSSATRTPTNSPIISLPDHHVNQIKITPLASPASVSVTSSLRRQRLPALPRLDVDEDNDEELRVVCSEEIVDGQVMKTNLMSAGKVDEAYLPSALLRDRPEYVPPRAFSLPGHRPDAGNQQEDSFNKGCYYFFACLDSFSLL